MEVWPGSPDLLDKLRVHVRRRRRGGVDIDGCRIENVRPWLWSAGTSGGSALSDVGRAHGYELRLSYYVDPLV